MTSATPLASAKLRYTVLQLSRNRRGARDANARLRTDDGENMGLTNKDRR